LTRRESITLVAWGGDRPASYGAAQQRMPLVGFLNSASPDTYRFNADFAVEPGWTTWWASRRLLANLDWRRMSAPSVGTWRACFSSRRALVPGGRNATEMLVSRSEPARSIS